MLANMGAVLVISAALIFNFSWMTFLWSFLRGKPEIRKVSKYALLTALISGVCGYSLVRAFSPTWANETEVQESADFIRGVSKPK
jgi:uncharacterized membrane protein YadS